MTLPLARRRSLRKGTRTPVIRRMSHPEGERTTMRTFRIPRELDAVLTAEAAESNRSVTEQYVSVLRNYVKYDRLARKFGFLSLSRATLRSLLEAIPEADLRGVADSQSSRLEALVEFFYKKKDVGAVLESLDLYSRYAGLFEYTTSQTDHELIITMRTELGNKGAIFLAEYWRRALERIFGPVQRIETVENQVTIWLAHGN